MITIFDVCSKMKEGTISLYYNMAGGRRVGKGKNKHAIVEVLVDNDTFQDFAFQNTYGHAKANGKEKIFVFVEIDKDEFDKQNDLLKNNPL